MIPQKPKGNTRTLVAWCERTFAPGTPVKVTRTPYEDLDARDADDDRSSPEWAEAIPRGTRGAVLDYDLGFQGDVLYVPIEITDARDPHGMRIEQLVGKELYLADYVLEPLADNWNQPGQRMSRYTMPSSQKSGLLKPNEEERRPAVILINTVPGDVRAARGVVSRAIRKGLSKYKRQGAPPHYVMYLSMEEMKEELPSDGTVPEPRYLLTVTDAEMAAVTDKLVEEAHKEGFDRPPVDIYHD